MEAKRCRVCGDKLVVGENWTKGNAKNGKSICQKCVAIYNKAYRQDKNNRERQAANMKAWREANPKRHAANAKAYREANPDWRTNYHLKHTYGITLVDYNKMLDAQGNGCAICGKTPKENGKRLDVDHDHKTGQVRGLLCTQCNMGLGCLGDSLLQLQAAVSYLKEE